jgi:hypothetical protein
MLSQLELSEMQLSIFNFIFAMYSVHSIYVYKSLLCLTFNSNLLSLGLSDTSRNAVSF